MKRVQFKSMSEQSIMIMVFSEVAKTITNRISSQAEPKRTFFSSSRGFVKYSWAKVKSSFDFIIKTELRSTTKYQPNQKKKKNVQLMKSYFWALCAVIVSGVCCVGSGKLDGCLFTWGHWVMNDNDCMANIWVCVWW